LLTEADFPQIRAQVEGVVRLDGVGVNDSRRAAPDLPQASDSAAGGEAQAQPPLRAGPRFGRLDALDERGNVRSLAAMELEMIRLAIDHYNGQMSEVARRLGIGRSTLYRKLKEHGIDPESGRAERFGS
jgi:DNA-binding NtrC family response regulator